MNNPLEQIQNLEIIINQLRNIDAKLDAGRIIRAHRETGKLLAYFIKTKQDLVADAKTLSPESQPQTILQCVECLQDLEAIIRQLHKIGTLIYSGQIVAAAGCNSKLVSLISKRYLDITEKAEKEKKK
jgi:hypothetical protein